MDCFDKRSYMGCSATFLVGNVDDHARLLVQATKECLDKAIAICGPNVPLKEIGRVIEYSFFFLNVSVF